MYLKEPQKVMDNEAFVEIWLKLGEVGKKWKNNS